MLLHEQRARSRGCRAVAGLDEAGRGTLAGPVVAACVILRETDFTCRIDDSKLLSAGARDRAYNEIVKKAHFSVGVVSERVIDKVNIFQATAKAMEKAVTGLSERPDMLLVDGRVPVKHTCKKVFIIHGDRKSLSIACASIVAKVTRDRIMQKYDRMFPLYGFGRHKGYATIEHRTALKRYGPSRIHRFSFKPVSLITSAQLHVT